MNNSFHQIRKKYEGKTCLIFGNGSSVTLDTIDMIHNSHKELFSFVSNGFCQIFDSTEFRPDAVCMSNHLAVKMYLHLYPRGVLKFIRTGWSKIIDYAPDCVFDLPFACEHGGGESTAGHYAPYIKDGNFSTDPSKVNYCGDTVVLDFCIPLAHYMGFSNLYLLGVDCDYTKGYLHQDMHRYSPPQMRSMSLGDDSIAIPSYRYTYEYLKSRGSTLGLLTPSEKLSFLPMAKVSDIVGLSV